MFPYIQLRSVLSSVERLLFGGGAFTGVDGCNNFGRRFADKALLGLVFFVGFGLEGDGEEIINDFFLAEGAAFLDDVELIEDGQFGRLFLSRIRDFRLNIFTDLFDLAKGGGVGVVFIKGLFRRLLMDSNRTAGLTVEAGVLGEGAGSKGTFGFILQFH
jgi:hypothetical protein